jgi:hypothetical protein
VAEELVRDPAFAEATARQEEDSRLRPAVAGLRCAKQVRHPRNNHGSDVVDKISLQEITEITEIV